MRGVLGIISSILILASGNNISEQCWIEDKTRISCRCDGRKEFLLPASYNYENVTSLRLESCALVNLHFSSLAEARRIEEIIVENVDERLNFEHFLESSRLKRLELRKIRRIPLISHFTFRRLASIESLRIEDTRIDFLEEQFNDIFVTNLSMINVTIEHIAYINFSGKGGTLRIAGSRFQNVRGALNFGYFDRVEILDSRFKLHQSGHLQIEGDTVIVKNSVFSNASINVVAATGITMYSVCADGKSSLRLSSSRIQSTNNKLPTEIVYRKAESEYLLNLNNTVCIAGNCKCRKSSGQVAPRSVPLTLVLQLLVSMSFSTRFS